MDRWYCANGEYLTGQLIGSPDASASELTSNLRQHRKKREGGAANSGTIYGRRGDKKGKDSVPQLLLRRTKCIIY